MHPGQSKIPWTQDAGTDKTIDNVLTQRFAMVFTPIKGWTINADYSIRLNAQKFTSENFTAYEDMVDGTMIPLATTVPSYIAKRQRNNLYQSTNMYTSYDFSLADKHNFTVMGGVQYETQRNEALWGRKNDLITPEVPSISTSTGDIQLTDEMEHWATAGAFLESGTIIRKNICLKRTDDMTEPLNLPKVTDGDSFPLSQPVGMLPVRNFGKNGRIR